MIKQSFLGRFLSKIFSLIKSNKSLEEDINVIELLDPNYSRDWEYEDGNIKYIRGGSPYYLPVGFRPEGINVERKFPSFFRTCDIKILGNSKLEIFLHIIFL